MNALSSDYVIGNICLAVRFMTEVPLAPLPALSRQSSAEYPAEVLFSYLGAAWMSVGGDRIVQGWVEDVLTAFESDLDEVLQAHEYVPSFFFFLTSTR